MNTVLIVEDEKLIRQGLRVMVQRSGVPITRILDCNNGEQALEVLKTEEVDVMFTDIRMPKMDGIELVQHVQALPQKPLIVAVSGYDDFSFAVEMLRNGVREYILKPVEREKVEAILRKFDEEISIRKKVEATDHQIGKAQLKHLLTEDVSPEEIRLISEKYAGHFFPEGYYICAAGKKFYMEEGWDSLFIDEIPDANVCVISPEHLEAIQRDELWKEYAGVSKCYRKFGDLRTAYREAMALRKRAFFRGEMLTDAVGENHVPEGLRKESLKAISTAAWTQRVHLIGTNREEEMESSWKQLFFEAEKERITAAEFEKGISEFLDGVQKIYRNSITDEQQEVIKKCRQIYAFLSLEEYREELMALVYEIHRQVIEGGSTGGSQQKIKQAIEYIREHYSEDLNMAVVSNYVSMNYSLFSYELKQYTGSNFVNFLKEIRIEKAKQLLAETDLKVVEISQSVGYENEKHFMKTFKKFCGVSPSEYRRLMQRES